MLQPRIHPPLRWSPINHDPITLDRTRVALVSRGNLHGYYTETFLQILHVFRSPFTRSLVGGGVGLGMHASFRVATEKTQFAMPETDIGYFTDVGATHFLAHLDGQLGTYLGLSSARVTGREALYVQTFAPVLPFSPFRSTFVVRLPRPLDSSNVSSSCKDGSARLWRITDELSTVNVVSLRITYHRVIFHSSWNDYRG